MGPGRMSASSTTNDIQRQQYQQSTQLTYADVYYYASYGRTNAYAYSYNYTYAIPDPVRRHPLKQSLTPLKDIHPDNAPLHPLISTKDTIADDVYANTCVCDDAYAHTYAC